MIVHSRLKAFLPVLIICIRCHSNDRYSAQSWNFPNSFRCHKPVHHRHLHVHENEVKIAGLRVFNGHLSVWGDDDCDTEGFK